MTKPDPKVPFALTEAERKLILEDILYIEEHYASVIRATPSDQPVRFTMEDWFRLTWFWFLVAFQAAAPPQGVGPKPLLDLDPPRRPPGPASPAACLSKSRPWTRPVSSRPLTPMPSSRTGRCPAGSRWQRSSSAARHNSSVMSVGSGKVWERVIEEKSAKRTLSCTVRPRSPCRRSRQPTCSTRSTSQARSTSMSRCRARRSSRWRSTWPPARARRAGRRGRGPTSRGARRCCRSGPGARPGATGGVGRWCGCPAAGRPCCSACRRPTAAPPAAGSRNSCTLSGSTTTRASGFFRSLAILARNLLGATPTETTSRSSSRIGLLDLPPDLGRRAEEMLAAGHVQEGFVQRQRLDQRREPLEDVADLAGDLGVVVDPGRQVDALRAEPVGGGRRAWRCGRRTCRAT